MAARQVDLRTCHPPTLKVYVEALTGLGHILGPDGLNTLFSQIYDIFENGSQSGNSGQNVYSKDRVGMRSLRLPGFSLRVNQMSCP